MHNDANLGMLVWFVLDLQLVPKVRASPRASLLAPKYNIKYVTLSNLGQS